MKTKRLWKLATVLVILIGSLSAHGVSRLKDGTWVVPESEDGGKSEQYGFWVDIVQEAHPSNKQVGIRWSIDGWRTVNLEYARFETNLASGEERWGVDVVLDASEVDTLEYAIFVEHSGKRFWDPRNNYRLGWGPVLPVSLEYADFVSTVKGMTLDGLITVSNYSFEKEVVVHYTLDGWASVISVNGKYLSGNHWTFSLPIPDESSIPIELAVEFKAGGYSHWDNNNGDNYKFTRD